MEPQIWLSSDFFVVRIAPASLRASQWSDGGAALSISGCCPGCVMRFPGTGRRSSASIATSWPLNGCHAVVVLPPCNNPGTTHGRAPASLRCVLRGAQQPENAPKLHTFYSLSATSVAASQITCDAGQCVNTRNSPKENGINYVNVSDSSKVHLAATGANSVGS